MLSPKVLIAEACRLFAAHRLDDALGVRVDGGATLATLLRALRHRAPDATDNGRRIANPLFNRSSQPRRESPQSKLGLTWGFDEETHLLPRC
jgi:hypothetical protein